jgi:hypothetical protein
LSKTAWTLEANASLTTLRSVVGQESVVRTHVVDDVATRLRLEHLAKFFERCASP